MHLWLGKQNEDEIDDENMTLEQKSKKEKEKALQKKFEDKIKVGFPCNLVDNSPCF